MLKSQASFLIFMFALWIAGCASEPRPTPSVTPARTPTAVPTAVSQTAASRTATFALVPGETAARYSIDQVLLNENGREATVIGKAGQVEGTFTLNYDHPLASQFGLFTANLKTLRSDQPQRDEALRVEWLESDRYPVASFQPREMLNFPSDARPGDPLRFQLVGDLTLKEVTREVAWDVTATLKLDQLTGTATTSIRLADFELPLPRVEGLLAATDGVTVTLDFTFKRTTPVPLPSCG